MMLARTSASLFFALAALSACVPDGKDDPEIDPNGIVCSAELDVAGSFVASMPQPEDVFGCWPVGVWTFKATLRPDTNECTEPPSLEPEYAFEVMRDAEENETYQYLTDPSNDHALMKVTSGGGGLCEGGLEIYSVDGIKYLNLKPALQADLSINGFGEYDVFTKSHW